MTIPDPPIHEHERRVVAVRAAMVRGHRHFVAVKLHDGTVEAAEDVIRAIQAGQVYTMVPPEGAPARPAYEEHRVALLLQVRQCPDCDAEALFA